MMSHSFPQDVKICYHVGTCELDMDQMLPQSREDHLSNFMQHVSICEEQFHTTLVKSF
jgi:hypothetical protein